jgi:uncharacterized OsmC-like protein
VKIALCSRSEPSPYPLPRAGRGEDSRSKRAVTYSDFENHASTPESEAMTADELRSLQAPLKAQYRERPETALATLMAEGRVGENMTCKIGTGKARVEAGLHPATGGDGHSACSADMLLEALVGCAGVTLSAVATALCIPLRNATIRAEGDLDFRGTLGVSKDEPVGFKQIRLQFDLDTDASEEQRANLIRLTERYCVVYQTLNQPPNIAVSHRVTSR